MAYSRNPRRLPNIGGFIDHEGRFHPIRSGEREITYGGQRVLVKDEVPYSRKRAHERPKAKRRNPGKRKKKNPPKLSKKQAFLRRMALGRARAKRARARR